MRYNDGRISNQSEHGRLLLASCDRQVIGCVAVRRIAESVREMKRLYVRPPFHRQGVGRALAQAVMEESQVIGYSHMRLDTLPWMAEAIEMYRSLGFREIEPYRYNPVDGAVFVEWILQEKRGKKPGVSHV